MARPLTRRALLAAGTAAAGAPLLAGVPAQANPWAHNVFGNYGGPRNRLDPGTVYVSQCGNGDYTHVAAAAEAAAPGTTVVIAAGTYRELVRVTSSQTGLTFIGATDDPHDVTIVYDLAAGSPDPDDPEGGAIGTSGSTTVLLQGADFTAHGITFANDFLRAEHPDVSGTQALAVKAQGDRSSFYRCRFLGHQDTLCADSSDMLVPARQYYRRCHIEGDVDFIFGRATAVFDRCEIECLERDVDFTPKGMPFAPSTSAEFEHGYLAVNCRITSSAGDGEYKISRPWVPSSNPSAWPALTVRDTWIGPGIDAVEPYVNMRDQYPWQEQRYFEYDNIGPGAEIVDPAARPPQLTEQQAESHTAASYLGDWTPYDEPDIDAPKRRSHTVFVTGDSTASTYEAAREPRTGWGQALPVFCSHRVEVGNRAWSGASSKSFADNGVLDDLAAELEPGDWLLISFGHNDQKTADPARGTDPYTTYQKYLRTYLEVARLRRAHPVLVTSVERRRFRDGHAYESLGDYPEAMRALAEEEGVPLIDLQAMSVALWDELGEEATKDHFLWVDPGHPNYPDGRQDNTHFQARGAIEVARLIAEDADSRYLFPRGTWVDLGREVDPSEIEWPQAITAPA
ncbi:pectinesterase family protein [Glycomyces sp. L485]|uniref:pectinesterase family protein n=1 Tax=Glycomyces sp. L485 TaxID=2909235 RepID=UPI001F4A7FE4|nr:pectinesterase family protein [Glycomyces sp. L485]MCH7230175.1 pectinesterase family protein [Glycomyces sp. L485]